MLELYFIAPPNKAFEVTNALSEEATRIYKFVRVHGADANLIERDYD